MSLEISPRVLEYTRPLIHKITQSLSLVNPHATPVAVKALTTQPKKYTVVPNYACIQPGETLHLAVCQLPRTIEPAHDALCRDKFKICSIALKPEWERSSRNRDGLKALFAKPPTEAKRHSQVIKVVWKAGLEPPGLKELPPPYTPEVARGASEESVPQSAHEAVQQFLYGVFRTVPSGPQWKTQVVRQPLSEEQQDSGLQTNTLPVPRGPPSDGEWETDLKDHLPEKKEVGAQDEACASKGPFGAGPSSGSSKELGRHDRPHLSLCADAVAEAITSPSTQTVTGSQAAVSSDQTPSKRTARKGKLILWKFGRKHRSGSPSKEL